MKKPVNFKNIYFQAFWISAVTLPAGFFLGVAGAYGGGMPLAIVGIVLIWPVQILTIVNVAIFDQQLINAGPGETPYLLYALVQYVGYLGLLYVVRLYRDEKTPAK